MSTPALLTAPVRRLPPAAATAPTPAEPLEVTLQGALLRDAEMRLSSGSRQPTVIVLLAQLGRPPVRAVELYPHGPAGQHAAYCKARQLRAGAQVSVRGEGLRPLKAPGIGEVVQLGCVRELRPLEAAFDPRAASANDGADAQGASR